MNKMEVSSYSATPDRALTVVPSDPSDDRVGSAEDATSRFDGFRPGFERFRGGETPGDERDLELVALLLREENAQLKAERHRPTVVGAMIAQMRRMAVERGEDELSNEAWSLLGECLVIQEELNQACEEIRAAMRAVQERLGRLAITIQSSNSEPSKAANHGTRARHAHAVVGPAQSQLAQVMASAPALQQPA